jgi:hypothetical protein
VQAHVLKCIPAQGHLDRFLVQGKSDIDGFCVNLTDPPPGRCAPNNVGGDDGDVDWLQQRKKPRIVNPDASLHGVAADAAFQVAEFDIEEALAEIMGLTDAKSAQQLLDEVELAQGDGESDVGDDIPFDEDDDSGHGRVADDPNSDDEDNGELRLVPEVDLLRELHLQETKGWNFARCASPNVSLGYMRCVGGETYKMTCKQHGPGVNCHLMVTLKPGIPRRGAAYARVYLIRWLAFRFEHAAHFQERERRSAIWRAV